MKTLISILAITFIFSSASAQTDHSVNMQSSEDAKTLSISWTSTTHDFEEIPAGEAAIAKFEFTNDGTSPISITKVKSSCGCTVAEYSKEPILPGKTGYVSATYNAARAGKFHKSVTVYINETSTYRLSVKGVVK